MRKSHFPKWSGHMATCPNDEFEADVPVRYFPGTHGRTYGPPELCYPPDPPELEAPAACEACGHVFTDDEVERWTLKIEERENDMDDVNPWKGDKREDNC